ncbi:sensor domain-containing diguanylate cyclase [Alteromonas sp. RKMC-009]|uniref:sensor domain-containing diguanylate cyclase n=1 Tax=Alteromonas sp. RKMC-009 TaxID=2267264 RepID=UPI000E6791F1|nr:tetratricopeptide repeat-containing diguanylate cyclase [Alteromonas sp. RKMC-009]AYA63702.1 diguanylate cyclase [Alteromonas sp. RKMC-009]
MPEYPLKQRRIAFKNNIIPVVAATGLIFMSYCTFAAPAQVSAPDDAVIHVIKSFHQHPQETVLGLEEMLDDVLPDYTPATIQYLLSYFYMKLGDFSRSESLLEQGLENVVQVGEPLLYHRLLLQKSQLYEKTERQVLALHYVAVVSEWAQQHTVTQLYIGALITEGLIQQSLQNREAALTKLIIAHRIASENATQILPAHIAGLIASVFQQAEQYDNALPYLQEALAIYQHLTAIQEILPSEQYYGDILRGLSNAHYHTGNFGTALDTLARAETISASATPKEMIESRILESRIQAALGNYGEAYQTLEDARNKQVKRLNEISAEKLFKLQTLFDVDKKSQENAALKAMTKAQELRIKTERQRGFFMISALVLLFSLCVALVILQKKRARYQHKLEQIAMTDSLTSLLNRQHTFKLLEEQADIAGACGKKLAVALLDIDLFKQVNDNFGHAAGDEVLRTFGALVRDNFRKTDITGRIGGEEFLLIFPDADITEAKAATDKFRAALKTAGNALPYALGPLTVSGGIGYVTGPDTMAAELEAIDKALYQAKETGRDAIIVVDKSTDGFTV